MKNKKVERLIKQHMDTEKALHEARAALEKAQAAYYAASNKYYAADYALREYLKL